MVTPFDYVTVGCFLGLVGAFFFLTARRPRTLLQLLLSAIAFAVANQLGNAGYDHYAVILIIAGVGYGVIVVRGEKPD
jgi:NhaP-type Na+/H+ or K+/H+ antiporter